jgi:CRP/FNR family cyclic AMP-dependent transcriptional regulator
VPYSYGNSGLVRDPFLAIVAVMLGGEALAPVRTRLVRDGDVLVNAGERVRTVYAVLSGRVGIYQPVQGDRPRLREVVGPGQRVGEAHVLAAPLAPADVKAECLSPGRVAIIDADLYWSWCRRPEVALPVLRDLAEQARARERLRSSWLELDVAARIAALLLDLHERFGEERVEGARSVAVVAHGLSQSQLGDLVGARRETANRAVRALVAEGLIADGPRGSVLRDVAGLAARAGRTTARELEDRRAVS